MGSKKIEISTDGEKYLKQIFPTIKKEGKNTKHFIDVYDVIDAYDVTDGALAHALKKILAVGNRGHKDEAQDRRDILESIVRSNEIFNQKHKETK